MRSGLFRISAGMVAFGLLAAPAAHAEWHGHRDHDRHGSRGHEWRGHAERHDDDGGALAGALVGLGLGAILGGVLPPSRNMPRPRRRSLPGRHRPITRRLGTGYTPEPSYGYPAPPGYYTAPYGQQ